jgi:hypothetical protein
MEETQNPKQLLKLQSEFDVLTFGFWVCLGFRVCGLGFEDPSGYKC